MVIEGEGSRSFVVVAWMLETMDEMRLDESRMSMHSSDCDT